MTLFVFEINNVRYGLDLDRIKEIVVKPSKIHHRPDANNAYYAFFYNRDDLINVFYLHNFLGGCDYNFVIILSDYTGLTCNKVIGLKECKETDNKTSFFNISAGEFIDTDNKIVIYLKDIGGICENK